MQISLLSERYGHTGAIHTGAIGGLTSPNVFKLAAKLVKRQTCWKRVENSNFCDFIFLSKNSWSIGQNSRSPQEKVSRHITTFSSFTSLSSKRKELFRKHGIEIRQSGEAQWFNRSLTVGVIFVIYP